MKADTLNFAKLFGADVQYVVPMFQRPYVWEREKQWEPLWKDVLDVVDAMLGAYQNQPNRAKAEESVAPHFLGAVVLDPLPTGAGQIDLRHIIDGQQRLTTLQLMIAAIHSVAMQHPELSRHQRVFEKLTRNDADLIAPSNPDQCFKVWPTKFDRDSFRQVLSGDQSGQGRLPDAYRFFFGACHEWAAEGLAADDLVERFDALQAVIRGFLKLVAIDLEPNDNSQVIFEVLNARGTELLAVDLIKNYAFRAAQERSEDVEFLYHTYWQKFDRAPWRVQVVVGRLRKARADQFMAYWLVMKTANDVHAQQLFPTFRRLLDEEGAQTVGRIMSDLSRHADVFDSFQAFPPDTPEGRFFYRISEIDISTFMPLLLYVFGTSEQDLPPGRRTWALSALESWLVRRALLRRSTKDYNKVVPMLIGRLQGKPEGFAADTLVDSLVEMEGVNRSWPTDAEILSHLRTDASYTTLKRGRLRMVLEAIENHLRGAKTEQPVPAGKLHIEHLLPQNWAANWPLPPGAGPMAGANRDALLHRLGNLTLLTRQLNSSQSNAPWLEKRAALEEHSVLKLNRDVLKRASWDEAGIEERTDELIGYITEIWPGPAAECWSIRQPVPAY